MSTTPRTYADLPPSKHTFEAIRRLFTLAGIAVEPGFALTDYHVHERLDMVRERMQELYAMKIPSLEVSQLESELASLKAEVEEKEAYIKEVLAAEPIRIERETKQREDIASLRSLLDKTREGLRGVWALFPGYHPDAGKAFKIFNETLAALNDQPQGEGTR